MRVRPVSVARLLVAVFCVGLCALAVSAAEGDRLEERVTEALKEGKMETVRSLLEAEATRFLNASEIGEAAAIYLRLGKIFEERDNPEEALSYFRAALTFSSYWDRPEMIAEARFGLGRAYEALGDAENALANYKIAMTIIPDPDPEPEPDPTVNPDPTVIGITPKPVPLACGSTNQVTPKTKDLPTGGLSGYGVGTNLEGAIVDILSSWLANTAHYPTCATKCPNGRAVDPTKDECKGSIKVLSPSTTPGDYGVTSWNEKAVTGGVRIGPVTITKIPTGLKAEQSCSACK